MSDIYSEIKDPEKVLTLLREFFDNHKIASADDIQEHPRIIEDADTLLEALGDHVGWAEPELDEDEDITGFDYDEDNPFLEED